MSTVVTGFEGVLVKRNAQTDEYEPIEGIAELIDELTMVGYTFSVFADVSDEIFNTLKEQEAFGFLNQVTLLNSQEFKRNNMGEVTIGDASSYETLTKYLQAKLNASAAKNVIYLSVDEADVAKAAENSFEAVQVDRDRFFGNQEEVEELFDNGGKVLYQAFDAKSINENMFRDYDYRSTEGGLDLSAKRLFYMTLTWISMAKEKAEKLGLTQDGVVIARDARKTFPEERAAVVRAAQVAGLKPHYIGYRPNCAASYAWGVRPANPLVGILLTASHMRASDVRGAKVAIADTDGDLQSLNTEQIKTDSYAKLDEILESGDLSNVIVPEEEWQDIIQADVDVTYVQMTGVVGRIISDPLAIPAEWKKIVGRDFTITDSSIVFGAFDAHDT